MKLKYNNEEFELMFHENLPTFMTYTWANTDFFKSFENLSGFRYNVIVTYTNVILLNFFESANVLEKAGKSIKNILKQKGLIKKQHETYVKALKDYKGSVKELRNINYSKLSNFEIIKNLESIQKKIAFLNAFSNFYYTAANYIEDELREEWKDESQETINKWFRALTVPIIPNSVNIFQKEVNKIIKKYPNFKDLDKSSIEVRDSLNKLAKDFFWMTDVTSESRTPDSFYSDIKYKEEDSDSEIEILDLDEEILLFFKIASYIKEEQSSLGIPFHWFSLINFWKEISKRVGLLSLDELSSFRHDEIIDYLQKNKKIKRDNVDKRKFFSIEIHADKGSKCYYANEAKEMFQRLTVKEESLENVESLSGRTAQGGLVKGNVKVVMTKDQFSNFKEGEILVAPYTGPDYVPIMKKASAIITDIGGLLSHAAIVSRELKIPCVIGTKIATKVLKDGDEVEVDADKGIVKIIKK
jgi:phosphoenolpyruvate synthase/pyruvate phosphate dikinase